MPSSPKLFLTVFFHPDVPFHWHVGISSEITSANRAGPPTAVAAQSIHSSAAQNEISQLILWALFKIAPVAALPPPALPWAKCFYCTNTQGPRWIPDEVPWLLPSAQLQWQFSTHLAASSDCQGLSFLLVGELGTRGNLFQYWFIVLYLSKRHCLVSIILLLFPV